MYEYESPYANYDQGSGLTPEVLLAKLNTLQGRIASTISEVQREAGEISEKQSQIAQTVDEISLEVFEIDTVNGIKTSKIAKLEVRADGIESEVFETDPITGDKISIIEQHADLISSKVSANGVISAINQSAEEITLDASRINLTGITNVANTLSIGESFADLTEKVIYFRGSMGAVQILSEANTNNLTISSMGMIKLESSDKVQISAPLDISKAPSVTWGNNVPGYAASSGYADSAGYLSGGYYPRDFVQSFSDTQEIVVQVNDSGQLILTVNGKEAVYSPITWTG